MEPRVDSISLDIAKITQSLKTNTQMLEPLSTNCCIYKAPPHLYTLNKEAYTPKLFSIGPFHHGKPELKSMETHKLRYLCSFLQSICTTMEDYIEELKKLENRLRESYVEIDGYNREKFIEIMAVDGAFLMDFLLMYYYEEFRKNDRIFGRQRLYSNVRHDLLLLENQVPFFFLEYLFSLYKNSNNIDEGITLMKIMQKFIIHEANPWKWCSDVHMVTKEKQVHHLLHLLIIYLSPSKRKTNGKCPSLFTPTISELHRAGVKFKTNSSNCLSSINFTNGILEVPKLRLTDDAEMIFRNIQAFEQCHLLDFNVGDYIFTMDMLINNEEDIKVLVHNGIISNWLENNQVAATMFNNLGKGNYTNVNDFSYASVVEDLNAYYKIRRHKWKATLKQKYFNNPWTIVSIVAAAFLLLLTLTQTVCSILQVV